jgi:uncharacterized cupin superfamily protein
MPKIDVESVPAVEKTGYPAPYAALVKGRIRKALGDAGGLSQFGVNLTRLRPGAASAHRHWHDQEDEFVYIVEGEPTLIEDDGEKTMRPGDAAAFKAGVALGHHLVNRTNRDVVYLEIGTRSATDLSTYTDPAVDMKFVKEGGKWRVCRRDGTPY